MVETKPVVFLEGLVFMGEVVRVKLEECEPGFARVLVQTRDGRIYATRCLHRDAARKLHSVWNIYLAQRWFATSQEA